MNTELPEPDDILDKLARVTVDAAVEVHRRLGPGFLEAVYEEALATELGMRGIPFARQVLVELDYKGVPVGQARIDVIVGGRLIVELKSTEALLAIHRAQLIAYLRATRQTLGLLINFNVPVIRQGIRRIILSPNP